MADPAPIHTSSGEALATISSGQSLASENGAGTAADSRGGPSDGHVGAAAVDSDLLAANGAGPGSAGTAAPRRTSRVRIPIQRRDDEVDSGRLTDAQLEGKRAVEVVQVHQAQHSTAAAGLGHGSSAGSSGAAAGASSGSSQKRRRASEPAPALDAHGHDQAGHDGGGSGALLSSWMSLMPAAADSTPGPALAAEATIGDGGAASAHIDGEGSGSGGSRHQNAGLPDGARYPGHASSSSSAGVKSKGKAGSAGGNAGKSKSTGGDDGESAGTAGVTGAAAAAKPSSSSSSSAAGADVPLDADGFPKFRGVCRVKGRTLRWQVCVYYGKSQRRE